ncbi:uncharacterized protein LOC116416683 [Nasonia vitripennis]|uniref:DUF4806 domain-containing protein n=1 Tax=Nasonia vitripennis TaxID=7425 RepID=A0A7M7T879_NASVI|nr:uncharacterized protein LOC116416683 [Nasonia vitripennis]
MADKKRKNLGALPTNIAATKLTKKMSSFSVSTGSFGRSAFLTETSTLSQPLLKEQQRQQVPPHTKSLQKEPPSHRRPLQQAATTQRKPLQQLQQQQPKLQQHQRKPLPQKKPQQQQQPLQRKMLHPQQPPAYRNTQQKELVPPAPRAQRNDVLNEPPRETLDSINRRLAALEGTQRGIGETLKQFKDVTSSSDERLKKMEQKVTAIYNILKNLAAAQSSATRTRPEFLPFKTTADIVAFDHLADDQFDALVHYLRYLGGANETDAAAIYFKACFKFHEDLFRNVTWHGSKSDNNILALKDTRFALACSEAMPILKELLRKPKKDEFATAMTKALKSSKEAYRRQSKRAAPPAEQSLPFKRQRQNDPPQNNAVGNMEYEYDLKPLLGGEVHQPIDNQLMDQQQPSDGDEEVDEDQFDDTQVIEEEQDEEGEEAEEYKEEEAEENEDFKEQEEEELDEPDTYFDDYGSKSINENQDDLQPSDEDLYPE